MNTLSPKQAREQLDEATARAELSHSYAPIGATFMGAIAVLTATLLATVTLLRDNPVAVLVSTAMCLIAIGLLIWWLTRKFRISDRSWPRRYYVGFGLTMALYVAGILWGSTSPSWAIFGPYCVLVAVPGLIAAGRMLRR